MRKSLFLLPLISGLVLMFAACSNKGDDVAGGPGSITTNGIAFVDGKAAPYARVALRKADYRAPKAVEENALVVTASYTDEKGMFDVDIPADGEYRLTVLTDGAAYSKVVTQADFAEVGKATEPDTVKLYATAVVAGVVDVPEGSSGVWVGVLGTDFLVKTNAEGWFALPAVPANDSIKLYFVSEDYSQDLGERVLYVAPRANVMNDYRSGKPADTTSKDTLPQDTLKKDSASVDSLPQIVALLNDSIPAKLATVALRAANAKAGKYVVQESLVASEEKTDVNGCFSMEWPSSGRYRLTVVSDSFAFSKEYEASELSKIDTVRLSPVSLLSSKVTLKTSAEYVWAGIYGLDVLVKTSNMGTYEIPDVPVGDSLTVYFVTADSNKLYAEWKTAANSEGVFQNPVKVLQDFENGEQGWYLSRDSIPGTEFKTANVKDGIEYDSNRKSHVFHGEYKLASADMAWVLVGTMFENYMNFSAIDSIVFYAKGNGTVKLALENYINDSMNIKASTDWIELNSTWKRISVNPTELCVGSASVETCIASWNTAKAAVKQLHIFPQGGTDFYIDDVTLYGAMF